MNADEATASPFSGRGRRIADVQRSGSRPLRLRARSEAGGAVIPPGDHAFKPGVNVRRDRHDENPRGIDGTRELERAVAYLLETERLVIGRIADEDNRFVPLRRAASTAIRTSSRPMPGSCARAGRQAGRQMSFHRTGRYGVIRTDAIVSPLSAQMKESARSWGPCSRIRAAARVKRPRPNASSLMISMAASWDASSGQIDEIVLFMCREPALRTDMRMARPEWAFAASASSQASRLGSLL